MDAIDITNIVDKRDMKYTQDTAQNSIYEFINLNNKISTIISKIHEISLKNQDTTKSQSVKDADACFEFLGQDKDSLCPHGLKFFQCMPCSH
jgi:hypothetical protein